MHNIDNDNANRITTKKQKERSFMDYVFRPAEPDEIDEIFSLFEERVAWMDEKGLRQWNATNYLNIYTRSFFRQEQKNQHLYVLTNGEIAGAVVMLDEDERWPEKTASSALYLHNLVVSLSLKGFGHRMLAEAEKVALQKEKEYVRLDCNDDNEFLNCFCESEGYVIAGECREGLYHGYLREKKLCRSHAGAYAEPVYDGLRTMRQNCGVCTWSVEDESPLSEQ